MHVPSLIHAFSTRKLLNEAVWVINPTACCHRLPTANRPRQLQQKCTDLEWILRLGTWMIYYIFSQEKSSYEYQTCICRLDRRCTADEYNAQRNLKIAWKVASRS